MRALWLVPLCAACLWASDKRDSTERSQKPASRGRTRVRLGGVAVSAGYSHFSGPRYWSPYYWGGSLWDPYWFSWSPYYFHPGFFNGFARGADLGEVKLASASKEGEVYLDGAYAGSLAKRKSMWLEPGKYQIDVKTPDGTFSRRIYVLSGKTLDLKVTPQPEGRS